MVHLGFTFEGRIGRVAFLLGSVASALAAAACVSAAIVLGVALSGKAGVLIAGLAMVPSVTIALWVSLSLQARRMRDIGWNPVVVIPAWFVLCVADSAMAHVNSALSVHWLGYGTLLSFGLSLSLALALLIMPGTDEDETSRATRLPQRAIASSPCAVSGPLSSHQGSEHR